MPNIHTFHAYTEKRKAKRKGEGELLSLCLAAGGGGGGGAKEDDRKKPGDLF